MKKILIVDDDERIAKALAVRLNAAGYRTFTAPDPAFAIIVAAVQRPDLVILDIWMPIMQGFTLAHRLDGLDIGQIPVIFITASRQEGLRESALRIGAAGFFEKPYDPEQMLRTVRDALDRPIKVAANA
jgi:DNA-binding response OmpR family regulator